ncbi:tegument protein [Pseudoscardovia radai]|uniref:Tegument protein n=1 Tax=Pseudoscardovia radai TaxID=987066 RepID=A0A261EZ78_9BIFI|nr:hypothetical protein [Pseudoscardovia radai]OZG52133.1 tegument protein [Pseudoscardovia radai]
MSDSNFAAPQQPVQPVQPQPGQFQPQQPNAFQPQPQQPQQTPQPTQGNPGLRNLLVSLNKTIFSIGADHPINITAIIGAVASLLCLISCFLPFASATAEFSYLGYSDSTTTDAVSLANGSDKGGMTTWGTILIVFSIVAILSFSMRNVATAVTIIVAGAVMLIDAFLANNDIHKQIDKGLDDQGLGMYSSMVDISVSLKIAFWLIIIASIVVILAGVAMLLQVQWGIATQTFKFGESAPQGQAQAQGQGFQSATSTMFAGAAQPQQPAPAQYAQPQQPAQTPVQPAQYAQPQTPVDPAQQQNMQ